MQKFFVIFLSLLFMTSCSLNQQSTSNHTKETPPDAEKSTNPSNDLTQDSTMTKSEAEEIVRTYLNLEKHTNTIVEFDHMKGNKFGIHVYDLIQKGSKEHTATRGWYYVDPITKEVDSMF